MPSWHHFNFGNAASNIVRHLCENHRLNSEGKRNAKCAYKNRCYNKIFVYFINKLFWLINYGSYKLCDFNDLSTSMVILSRSQYFLFFNSNVQNAYKHILLKERKGMREEGARKQREGGQGERGKEHELFYQSWGVLISPQKPCRPTLGLKGKRRGGRREQKRKNRIYSLSSPTILT